MNSILEVKNLNKSYGKQKVLKDLNISIKKREIVALVGVNGSGKSTLMDIICGIKKANSGQIFFDHKNISIKKNLYQMKMNISYFPQNFSLFSDLTVKENLEYRMAVYGLSNSERIYEVMRICYLRDHENKLAKDLSGGFKQLLSLAVTIINNPDLLIMDEPTSSMDPVFRKRFWNIIHALHKKGSTVFVTTHYIEEISECDRVICLSDGKNIHETTIENIFENGKFLTVEEMLNYYILKDNYEEETGEIK